MWLPSKEKKEPLYQQIIEHLIQQIQIGELLPGDTLLAERKLADRYHVNRSTVVRALDELSSIGWIERKHGSGTIVSENPPSARHIPTPLIRLLGRSHFQEDYYTTAIKEQLKDPQTLDFFTGDLPLDLIPDFEFPAISWEHLITEEKKVTASGYEPLKQYIRKKLIEEMALPSKNQEVLITSGSTQGMILLLQNLLKPGDCVATEDPSFLFSLPIFAPLGIELVGIKQDEEGISCRELEKNILQKRIKLLYLNPNYQNPTSQTISLARRREIIELCKKYEIPIIEDDVFADFDFTTPLPTLKQLAPEQVIYLGSFSKLFSSRIKIGWIYASDPLIKRLTLTKQQTEQETELFPQLLATSVLTANNYPMKHQQLRNQLMQRRDYFVEGMDSLKEFWSYEAIQGGLYYWVTWRGDSLSRTQWRLFLEENLAIAPSFLFGRDSQHFRLNYTRLNEENRMLFFQKIKKITDILKQQKKER